MMVDAVNRLIIVLRVYRVCLVRREACYNAIKLAMFVIFRLNSALSTRVFFY
jgi:hypothetical protein